MSEEPSQNIAPRRSTGIGYRYRVCVGKCAFRGLLFRGAERVRVNVLKSLGTRVNVLKSF